MPNGGEDEAQKGNQNFNLLLLRRIPDNRPEFVTRFQLP